MAIVLYRCQICEDYLEITVETSPRKLASPILKWASHQKSIAIDGDDAAIYQDVIALILIEVRLSLQNSQISKYCNPFYSFKNKGVPELIS